MRFLVITFTFLFLVTLSHCEEESEFIKYISCHKEDKPKEEYGACLKGLAAGGGSTYKRCCMAWYETDFCNNAVRGKIDFDAFCSATTKAAQISACFDFNMNKDNNETKTFAGSSDFLNFEAYLKCKEDVKTRYCKETHVSRQHFSENLPPQILRLLGNRLMLTNFQKDEENFKAGFGKKKRAIARRYPRPKYCALEAERGGRNTQYGRERPDN